MGKVAVVGATGRQGLAQTRQLLSAGYEVRALTRSIVPHPLLDHPRISIGLLDLENENTYREAFEGVDAVFYTHPLQSTMARSDLIPRVALAAKEAGVSRFVWNTSMWIPDRPGDPFVYGENTKAINALFRTGIGATVFGAVIFMDNLLTDWARPFITKEQRYVYPHSPTLAANWISLDDVGKIMVECLNRPDFEGSWLNIGGPERLTPPQVAHILSQNFGHEIRYEPCTPEEFGDLLVKAMPDSVPSEHSAEAKAFMKAFYEYNNTAPTKPFEVNVDYMMERLPNVELETLAQWTARQDWSDGGIRPSGG
jgi:uncharacterized protein YbjT (DUF2867 family)